MAYFVSKCHLMHKSPILTSSSKGSFLDLSELQVPKAYHSKRPIPCSFVTMLDPFEECVDADRTNNFKVFPVEVSMKSNSTEVGKRRMRKVNMKNGRRSFKKVVTNGGPHQVAMCKATPSFTSNGRSVIFTPNYNKAMSKSFGKSAIGYRSTRRGFIAVTKQDLGIYIEKAAYKITSLSEDICPNQCNNIYEKLMKTNHNNEELTKDVKAFFDVINKKMASMEASKDQKEDLEKYKLIVSTMSDIMNAIESNSMPSQDFSKFTLMRIKDAITKGKLPNWLVCMQ